jgi:hypothetical protein
LLRVLRPGDGESQSASKTRVNALWARQGLDQNRRANNPGGTADPSCHQAFSRHRPTVKNCTHGRVPVVALQRLGAADTVLELRFSRSDSGRAPSVDAEAQTFLRPGRPTFAELFTPKLVTILQEGYGWAAFRADLFAGLTVAIVAAPLSMAIAIASGVSPERGLYTAIVGGFLVSALGGSRFQIGGPAGAFIVLVAATVQRHGIDGLVLATLMAGLFSHRHRQPAAGHLHPVHPLSSNGRLHHGHRHHHFCQPGARPARP